MFFEKISVSSIFFLIVLNCSSCAATSQSTSSTNLHPLDRRIEYLESQFDNNSIISFKIPPCDPISKTNLKTRSFTYDVAIAVILFEMLQEHQKAINLLSKIEGFISPESGIEFSYDSRNGSLGMRYVRTGAAAWLGYALVYSNRLEHAIILADFLLTRRVEDSKDPRNGLFRGGFGEIKKDRFVEKEIEWVSTEHNIDTYFFFRDIGLKLKATKPQIAFRFEL
jgi:hypothetical protein